MVCFISSQDLPRISHLLPTIQKRHGDAPHFWTRHKSAEQYALLISLPESEKAINAGDDHTTPSAVSGASNFRRCQPCRYQQNVKSICNSGSITTLIVSHFRTVKNRPLTIGQQVGEGRWASKYLEYQPSNNPETA